MADNVPVTRTWEGRNVWQVKVRSVRHGPKGSKVQCPNGKEPTVQGRPKAYPKCDTHTE